MASALAARLASSGPGAAQGLAGRGGAAAGLAARRVQARGLVRHVVMFGFRDGVTQQQKVDLKAAFDAMPGKIPQIRQHQTGLDSLLPSGRSHPAGKNRDFVWWCDFEDADAYEEYAGHPDHLAVLAQVKEVIEAGSRAAIQYEH
ncbi:unnamed protein product [Prorocentrum cordatum]|uniref:Stress-response A/B barrel domain-containing protein n=1 Tax=Prorocentrum cordatum TaxID=2364126 RepID=A0ABN9X2Z8_9DINO|nr:unnamed protein product [Polarella glacialis]|mmetsp:Transcript_76709/g.199921  ORF Transcript_76709/g.199921 Transcript_76709/m.199921 type:complete len:145 (+) Transcript_76709:2-436(+)